MGTDFMRYIGLLRIAYQVSKVRNELSRIRGAIQVEAEKGRGRP